MAKPPTGKVPMVVHGTEPASQTLQTPGMERKPAIHKSSVGASKIWFGTVTCAPNHKGPPHHHGEAETAAYIISGYVRVHYGENFEESVEAGPGDYLFVPANTWHIEENPYDTSSEQFLTRGPDNIVVNME
jgi:uncharacterized RmlC-like cupin family protein